MVNKERAAQIALTILERSVSENITSREELSREATEISKRFGFPKHEIMELLEPMVKIRQ